MSSIKTHNHCDIKLDNYVDWKPGATDWINQSTDLPGEWDNAASPFEIS